MAPNDHARSSLTPGTRFGRYEVIAEIAAGGMAAVYLGRALGAAGFQRLVAIKVMHPHVARDEEFVAMFMDEARLAARIRHPNAVATLDLENGDDGLFLVMEYIEGDGLLHLMKGAAKAQLRIPPTVVLRITLDTLAGLHAAHELTGDRGEPLRLVHRDVSPHNILVGVDGISRITDFGIARAEERVSATREGQIKGKLSYMAPEQTESAAVDQRADLFAVGVVLWECLAGRRLFYGSSDGEVYRKLMHDPIPSLRSVAPEMPAALDAVCAKALSRDRDARYVSASQFADALEEAGGSIGIASPRAVSKFLRQISGARIDAMNERVRGTATDPNLSAVRAVTRGNTDPDRTMRRSEPSLPVIPVPPSVASLSSDTATAATPAPVASPSNELRDAELSLEDPPAPRRTGAALFALVLLLALGGGAYAMFGHPASTASSHPVHALASAHPSAPVAAPPSPSPSPSTASPASEPVPPAPEPAPLPSEPTPSAAVEPESTTTTSRGHRGRHVNAPASGSTHVAPAESAPATAPAPAPTPPPTPAPSANTPFNPEAM